MCQNMPCHQIVNFFMGMFSYIEVPLLIRLHEVLTILKGPSCSTCVWAASLGGGHQHTAVVGRVRNDIFNPICGCKSICQSIGVDNASVLLGEAKDLEVLKVSIPRVIPRSGPTNLHCS